MTSGDLQGMRALSLALTSVSTAVISRPSRERNRLRCAEAPSMSEGPAERGVEANASAYSCGALVTRGAFDGAEHSGSIERVMAGRHAAAGVGLFQTSVAAQ